MSIWHAAKIIIMTDSQAGFARDDQDGNQPFLPELPHTHHIQQQHTLVDLKFRTQGHPTHPTPDQECQMILQLQLSTILCSQDKR